MLISFRCSLLTGQFAQWRGHGKSYSFGVLRFMFEAWLFVLVHRARLPDTVDFVLYDLFSIFANICAQSSAVEYRHLISYTRSPKYCRLWWQMLGKMELFRRIVVFRLLFFDFREHESLIVWTLSHPLFLGHSPVPALAKKRTWWNSLTIAWLSYVTFFFLNELTSQRKGTEMRFIDKQK